LKNLSWASVCADCPRLYREKHGEMQPFVDFYTITLYFFKPKEVYRPCA
jgi:hypothetical protein